VSGKALAAGIALKPEPVASAIPLTCFSNDPQASCQATPLGGWTSGDHTSRAECRLSFHLAWGGTAASVRPSVVEASPDVICRTSAAACRKPVKAGSTHCMALGRAANRTVAVPGGR